MTTETLSEREFELINIIGPQLSANQRYLSKKTGMSLGMVNMVLRRLVAKGCIRMNHFNKRKVQYLLTTKGVAEKVRKSIHYTWKTIHSISSIKASMHHVLLDLYQSHHRKFFIYGKSDFGKLVEIVFANEAFAECQVEFIDQMPDHHLDGLLLICKEEVDESVYNKANCIDLVSELAKHSYMKVGYDG